MRVLGLLSGTSVDGVDAALAELALDGDTLHIGCLGDLTVPWPEPLRERLLAAATASTADLTRLHRDLGVALGAIAASALERLGPADLIASHGQTVHHDVDERGRVRGTLQLGQPAEIAERTGLPVVADFRVRDVAAGGQGAPLVSILDQLLLAAPDPAADPADHEPMYMIGGDPGAGAHGQLAGSVAALNLGGIANLTVVRRGRPALAFDTGPGNALLDAAMVRAGGEPYDAGGARAAAGTVDPALLAVLLADPYLAADPPKSTGKERYHAGYLESALNRAPPARLEDLLATLAEFTAAAVADGAARFGVRQVWASGGGVHHHALMAALRRRLAAAGATLETTAALGLPVDAKEAYAFAVLGWLTWHGLPGTVPSCTGAAGPRILGAITPGGGSLRLPPPAVSPPRRAVLAEDRTG